MNTLNAGLNAGSGDVVTLQGKDGSIVKIALHGAHVLSWVPAGESEQLFLSSRSAFEPGVAIRGGIPVIFPQFANVGPLPKHGFARTTGWQLADQANDAENGKDAAVATALFELHSDSKTLAIWPHAFLAQLQVSVSERTLMVELRVQNTDDHAFSYTAALHTYLQISQIADISLQGMKGVHYRDSVTGTPDCYEESEHIRIQGEVDRIYQQAPSPLEVLDTDRRIRITHQGFADAVVWNPGAILCAKLADMEANGYQHMLCVEGAAIVEPVCLQPGEQWRGSQRLTLP